MPAQMRRVAGAIAMILMAAALIEPVAVSADEPRRLQPWQEQAAEEALQDPSAAVRLTAIRWRSDYPASDGWLAPHVAELLKDPNKDVRNQAAEALGTMGAAGAAFAPQVATLLKDPNEDTRNKAASALGVPNAPL